MSSYIHLHPDVTHAIHALQPLLGSMKRFKVLSRRCSGARVPYDWTRRPLSWHIVVTCCDYFLLVFVESLGLPSMWLRAAAFQMCLTYFLVWLPRHAKICLRVPDLRRGMVPLPALSFRITAASYCQDFAACCWHLQRQPMI